MKGVTVIAYNYLNLPELVTKAGDKQMQNIYDATGRKLAQELSKNGVAEERIDHNGEFFYKNDTLQFIAHEEGRVVPDTVGNLTYEYNLSDHLGNVRLTFTTKEQVDAYTAGFEDANAANEQAEFNPSYDNAVIVSTSLYNHTTGGTKSQRLSAANQNEIIGLARSFKVVPGDTVSALVYAKYFTPTTNNTNVVADMALAIVNAFGLTPTSTGEALTAYQSLNTIFTPGPILGPDDWENEAAPKAFLTYILFDEDFAPYDFGFDQIDIDAQETGSGIPHDLLTVQAAVRKPGYAYIYLSNENDKIVDVFFDDLLISHKHSPVLEETMYYPFGLLAGTYQKPEMTRQPFKYNGKEEIEFTEWYDYGARMYMSDIGRWGVIDPHAFKYHSVTPYNYAFNSPMLIVDPTGKDGVLYLQVMTDEKGKTSMNKKHLEKSVAKLNAVYKKMGVDLKVELHYGNKIMSKSEFVSRKGDDKSAAAHKSDSYIVVGSTKQLDEASKSLKEGGWNMQGLEGKDFSKVDGTTSRGDQLSLVNGTNMNDLNKVGAEGTLQNFTDPSEKFTTTVMHESGHPKFKNARWADRDGHSVWIMDPEPKENSAHTDEMIQILKRIHGSSSNEPKK